MEQTSSIKSARVDYPKHITLSLIHIFQAIDAPPHNFLSAMDTPGNPAVQAAADAAHQSLRQGIFAGKPSAVGFRSFGIGGPFAVSA